MGSRLDGPTGGLRAAAAKHEKVFIKYFCGGCAVSTGYWMDMHVQARAGA